MLLVNFIAEFCFGKVSFYIYKGKFATFWLVRVQFFFSAVMELPSRSEILFHKPIWGTTPFLLCRSVTPVDLRDSKKRCNCRDCYLSRTRTVSDYLSHPFGSRSNPPRGSHEFAQHLRNKWDMDRDVFALDNSIILLKMIDSDSDVVATFNDPIRPVISIGYIQAVVRDLLIEDPGDRSLNGLFYDRLKVYDLRRKGPRLLRRARRSHSIRPHASLYDLPEIVDTWGIDGRVYFDPPDDFSNSSVANFPSSIERLVYEGHFHDRTRLTFEFSDPSKMSKRIPRRKRSRSAVSCYFMSRIFGPL